MLKLIFWNFLSCLIGFNNTKWKLIIHCFQNCFFFSNFHFFMEFRHEGVIFRGWSKVMNWSLGPIKHPRHNNYPLWRPSILSWNTLFITLLNRPYFYARNFEQMFWWSYSGLRSSIQRISAPLKVYPFANKIIVSKTFLILLAAENENESVWAGLNQF